MLLWGSSTAAPATPNPHMQTRSRPFRAGSRPQPGRLLLIGPRVIEGDVVGGTQVTFESVIEELRRRAAVGLTVVNTARPLARRGKLGKALLDARTLVLTLARTWRHAASAQLVVWFVSARGALLAGPGVWLVCTLRRRPLCIRLFGGSFDRSLESAPAPCRLMARRTFLKAELLLLETGRSAAALEAVCTARWTPAARNLPPRRRRYRPSCRRLLFLSVLLSEKGLPELIAAARRFPPGVRLSVCGPETPGFDVAELERAPRTSYGGVVPPERVPEVLEAHDAVVLPTRWFTEGYPGVVIEAFQMGLPVIVSRLASLEELVTDGEDGLFVEPGSVDSLVEAVVRLSTDDELFRRLRSGALRTGELYRSARAAAVLEDLCRQAARRRG